MACTPTYRCQGTAMQAGESGASKTGTGQARSSNEC